jgi:hypothetical protein
VLYQTHDVTSLLKSGDNVLAAELGRGWYGVTEPNEWYFHKAPWTAEPALKARLEIVLADGSTQVLVSDEAWRTLDGPCLWDSIYAGERRDARREPTGWRDAGFDDRAWDAALTANGPAGTPGRRHPRTDRAGRAPLGRVGEGGEARRLAVRFRPHPHGRAGAFEHRVPPGGRCRWCWPRSCARTARSRSPAD